jgi:hypothetical protein
MDCQEWAAVEFAGIDLGDLRRDRRVQRVAATLAAKACGTLPGSFTGWGDLKAAYRLVENPRVSYQQVIEPHFNRVRQDCGQGGEQLMIEDTTELDLTSAPAEDLGPLDEGLGRGMYVHSTLALRVDRWSEQNEPEVTVVGLAAQQVWMRPEAEDRPTEETVGQRLSRSRESQRWAAAVEQIGPPPSGRRYTHVADRESDVYEAMERCQAKGWDFIIRANQPRALVDPGGSVFEAVAGGPVLGRFSLKLRSRPQRVMARNKKTGRRTRVRQAHGLRTVQLEVRGATVTLRPPWRPGEKLSPRQIQVVQAREVDPRPGDDPIHWVLLTSWPCDNIGQAMRVLKAYACRWLIEEYHKALKTGTRIESTQLTKACRIQVLLGLLAVVSVRLLGWKLLARTCGEQPVEPGEADETAVLILESLLGRPTEGWTNRQFFRGVARLGGFIGRKADGEPGWITIWRGWMVLHNLVRGFNLAEGKRCG